MRHVPSSMARAVAVLALLAGVLLAPEATGQDRWCAGGRTVASTDKHRIYAQGGIYLACLRSVGRPTELYEVDSDMEFGSYEVAGRYIAVIADSAASDGYDSWVVFADMRTGRATSPTEDEVSKLALRATGSLAWSRVAHDGLTVQVRLVRWGRRGGRTIASAEDIDPLSLRRVRRRACWDEHVKSPPRCVRMP